VETMAAMKVNLKLHHAVASAQEDIAPPPVGWSHDTTQYITITAGGL
jgi:hypothetical protein